MNDKNIQKDAGNMLGLYKAEWLDEKLYELFRAPNYFQELETKRPCVLIGGRGTGKTTVLKGLSYQGQYVLCGKDPRKITKWAFFGLYWRVNTNRVTAFKGPELVEQRWIMYFSHYLNLILCQLMLDCVRWVGNIQSTKVEISPSKMRAICATLNIPVMDNAESLSEEIELLILRFEASINNIADNPSIPLSMLGSPLDVLAEALSKCDQIKGRQFYFLIDEFENLEDYQQRVFNTIIKHSNANYTFKIGVRELGWRQRATLNSNEQLRSPADYERLNISDYFTESKFSEFAERVIQSRISSDFSAPSDLLPGLTDFEEGDLLLEKNYSERISEKVESLLTSSDLKKVHKLRPSELYFLEYWSRNPKNDSLVECIKSYLQNKEKWKDRFNNHFYASLFAIRKGKRGIRKYYAGWDVFVTLSHGNIRYLLELVNEAFMRHKAMSGNLGGAISFEAQTEAAEFVGRKNLSELEGLSVEGGRLTKLLLSLGRIFQVFAADPNGHTPETNQFHLSEEIVDPEKELRIQNTMHQAVMHLALIRFSGNKATEDTDTRAYDYMMHPIFAPFFVFSHRKKRQLTINGSQLLGLIDEPKSNIKKILSSTNRSDSDSLPDQLQLFESYYAVD
ncbi:hypothetical protein GTP58_11935 [Duganella sp. CY15W]|uniref:ORC-CDC6 family AAA ATPase n=1 Tax=Duganella sp. CY15W TaxID=2692172 RepID=UPI00136D35FA|nr:hypothetical protein [Duganella sp. CY15W]MYM29030.1 hypothetical protein [Duganella sp. CY15W]